MNVEIGIEAAQFPENKWDFLCSASLENLLLPYNIMEFLSQNQDLNALNYCVSVLERTLEGYCRSCGGSIFMLIRPLYYTPQLLHTPMYVQLYIL